MWLCGMYKLWNLSFVNIITGYNPYIYPPLYMYSFIRTRCTHDFSYWLVYFWSGFISRKFVFQCHSFNHVINKRIILWRSFGDGGGGGMGSTGCTMARLIYSNMRLLLFNPASFRLFFSLTQVPRKISHLYPHQVWGCFTASFRGDDHQTPRDLAWLVWDIPGPC